MPKVTDEHSEARKAQILGASFRCLASKGYSRTTIRDIAREAGLSLGTIYLYFDNKEAIVRALAEATRSQADKQIEAAFPDGGSLEMIRSVFETVLKRYDEPDSAAPMSVDLQLWAEALHYRELQELFVAGMEQRIEKFSALIIQAQRDRLITSDLRPEALARLFMAIFIGLEIQKVMEPEQDLQQLLPVVGSLLKGLSSLSTTADKG